MQPESDKRAGAVEEVRTRRGHGQGEATIFRRKGIDAPSARRMAIIVNVSGLPEPLRSRVTDRTDLPTLDKVRYFLHAYVADDFELEEIRQNIRRTARRNTFFLRQYLAAMAEVLSEPQPPGTLMRLVEGDANRCIDHDQSDEGAAVVLRELADLLQSVIDEVEPSAC